MKQIKAGSSAWVEHRATMQAALLPPPSCCAGLQQTLLQGWRDDFPLHPSPFRQMAVRSGATPRELLDACAGLQRKGSLQAIRVRWGAALQRERWRLGFQTGTDPAALDAAVSALAALPGCLRIEEAETSAAMPRIWAELEVLDGEALAQQLARLPLRAAVSLRLSAGRACGGGPRDDPQLAACLERGLPLCANPYARCARQLDRSERQLLAELHGWQRAGQLESLVLRPPPPAGAQTGQIALWQAPTLAPGVLERLRALVGIERLISAPPSPNWPWGLMLVSRATAPLAAQQLRLRLAEVGLRQVPDSTASLRIRQVRNAALLFSAQG